jgi:uncharacterized membrane protein
VHTQIKSTTTNRVVDEVKRLAQMDEVLQSRLGAERKRREKRKAHAKRAAAVLKQRADKAAAEAAALAAAEQAEIDARVQLEEALYQCMVRRPLRHSGGRLG